jgi:AraC-like DNA-binding protein
MSRNRIHLSETTVAGAGTREWLVRADAADVRPWLAGAPVCAGLARRGIVHVGVAEATHPYRVVRPHLSGTFLMACFDGAGRVLLDGQWRVCRAGMACLAPPHVAHAYSVLPRGRWGIAWVRYQEPAGQRPIVSASSPLLAAFDAEPLRAAIMGLYHEARGPAIPALADRWVELIDQYVLRFAQPWREDDRLRRLWEEVAAHLADPWPLARLAQRAGLSVDMLRRLSRRALGRSPKQHVTFLRMERAAMLLAASSDKVETIAREVGYENAFVFSNKFKQWTGVRPSEYRPRPTR